MSEFEYESVLLHRLVDHQGWRIVGIKTDETQELIAFLPRARDELIVQRWADRAAQLWAGKMNAEVD